MAIRPIEELVTNRTLNDVKRNTTKGNYNASDLNRIESWMEYLKELLSEYGYHTSFITKTDWTIGIGKTNMTSEINRIKTNLQKLKDVYFVMQSTPDVPSTDRLSINYVEANNIEKIIVDLEYLVESMGTYFVHCGVANCGQNKVWQRRFRPRRTWNNIVFNTFSSLLDWITFENVSVVNESEVDGISKYNDVYATLVYQNNKYNEIDDLVGGIDVNN